MSKLTNFLANTYRLPAYWRDCRTAYAELDCTVARVNYGPHPKQYALVVRSAETMDQGGQYAFYFHGGAWTFGRPETFAAAARPWLERGFTVILPSYRRPPTVGLNGVVRDCKAAIRHFAPDETVSAIHLAGISAGAHLAALLATDQDFWPDSGWHFSPTAVLACAGPLSFSDLRPRQLFLPRYAHLDPLQQVRPATVALPRWLLLHGTDDATVDIGHSRKFYRQLLAQGYPAELREIPGGSHLDAGRWMFPGNPLEELIRDFVGGK